MKTVKTILSIVLCVAVLATTGVAFYNNYTQNRAGRYTAVTTISDTEREWILGRFGREYGSIEEYISTVQSYARANFQYHHDKTVLFQHFDFDDIKDGDRIYGICFDFAVLFKHITLVLDEAELLPIKDFKVYVVDIAYEDIFKPHHSYIIYECGDGRQQYIRYNKKQNSYSWEYQPKGYMELSAKIEWVKEQGLWQQVRKYYLYKKNINDNPNKHSRTIFAETIHEIWQKNKD